MKNLLFIFLAFSICSSLAIPPNGHTADNAKLTAETFTKEEWNELQKQVQKLENKYKELILNTDITKSRQIVLEQAQNNPVFSSAVLSYGALNLVYKGLIPIILDLPDPNAPPHD